MLLCCTKEEDERKEDDEDADGEPRKRLHDCSSFVLVYIYITTGTLCDVSKLCTVGCSFSSNNEFPGYSRKKIKPGNQLPANPDKKVFYGFFLTTGY